MTRRDTIDYVSILVWSPLLVCWYRTDATAGATAAGEASALVCFGAALFLALFFISRGRRPTPHSVSRGPPPTNTDDADTGAGLIGLIVHHVGAQKRREA